MDNESALRRGGALIVASLAVMALYFGLIGRGWPFLAMLLAGLAVAALLPRRRRSEPRAPGAGRDMLAPPKR